MSSQPSTTWEFVRISPRAPTTTPLPVAVVGVTCAKATGVNVASGIRMAVNALYIIAGNSARADANLEPRSAAGRRRGCAKLYPAFLMDTGLLNSVHLALQLR